MNQLLWAKELLTARTRAARLAEAVGYLIEAGRPFQEMGWFTGSEQVIQAPKKMSRAIASARAALSAPDAQAGVLWAAEIADLLKSMCSGQGEADLYIAWDSATGEPKFDVNSHRERDGEILDRRRLNESEFIALVVALKGETK